MDAKEIINKLHGQNFMYIDTDDLVKKAQKCVVTVGQPTERNNMEIITCTRYIVSVEHTETYYNEEIECNSIFTANELVTELLTRQNPNKSPIIRVVVRKETYKMAVKPLEDKKITR